MPCYDATVEGYENGAVVAAVLGLGVGCVAVCCIWHLIHVLPLVIIPAIYFYRNKLRSLDFIFAFFPTLRRENGRRKMNLEGNRNLLFSSSAMAGGDQTLWESMKELKKQNERLTRELNRQSRVTQFLLKQLEDMTSMSNTEESNEEQVAAHDDIFEEEDQISGR
uniref:Uncharacterized protein n=1 Tax=Angiostrongylus cantonensis TaxID=6313 RepID=A0A0K0CSY6_ANGCA